jgi:hypothetical protein
MKPLTIIAILCCTLVIAAPVTSAPGASVPAAVSASLAGIVECPKVKVQFCFEVSPDPECPLLGEWGWVFTDRGNTKGWIYLVPFDCQAEVPGTDCGWCHAWMTNCAGG